jgi:hypothetical protein
MPGEGDGGPTVEWVIGELAALGAHGLSPVLFGGWAKELLGGWTGGRHGDLDVLVRARRIDELDACIRARGGEPLAGKRHPHKRAYVSAGTLVELFLVTAEGSDLVTDFYGRYRRVWSPPISAPMVVAGQRIEVATAATIVGYERDHRLVQDALFACQPGLRPPAAELDESGHVPCRHPFGRP